MSTQSDQHESDDAGTPGGKAQNLARADGAPVTPQPPAGPRHGKDPSEFGEYGMHAARSDPRNDGASLGSSDHGAQGDHQSADAEFRVREERNKRERSIPNGLSQVPDSPADESAARTVPKLDQTGSH